MSSQEATRRLRETDRARALYVRYYYRREWNDGTLNDLVVDGTRISMVAGAAIVLQAVRDRQRQLASPPGAAE